MRLDAHVGPPQLAAPFLMLISSTDPGQHSSLGAGRYLTPTGPFSTWQWPFLSRPNRPQSVNLHASSPDQWTAAPKDRGDSRENEHSVGNGRRGFGHHSAGLVGDGGADAWRVLQ